MRLEPNPPLYDLLRHLPSGTFAALPPKGRLVAGDKREAALEHFREEAFLTEKHKATGEELPVSGMVGIIWNRGERAKHLPVLDTRNGRPGKAVDLPDGAGAFKLTGDLAERVPDITMRLRHLFSDGRVRLRKPKHPYEKRILAYYGKRAGREYTKVPLADVLSSVDAETADFIVRVAKTIADFVGIRDYSAIERWTVLVILYPEAPRRCRYSGFRFHTDGVEDFGGPGMVFNLAMGSGDTYKYFDYKPLFGKHRRVIRQKLSHGTVAFMTGESRTMCLHGVPKQEGEQITLAFKLPAEDYYGACERPSHITIMKHDPQFRYDKTYYDIDATEAHRVLGAAAQAENTLLHSIPGRM